MLEPYNTTVSSVIVYQCQPGFTPTPSDSVCGENGTWSPDPSQVTCRMIPTTSMPSMSPTTTGEMLVVIFFCLFVYWKGGVHVTIMEKQFEHKVLNHIRYYTLDPGRYYTITI